MKAGQVRRAARFVPMAALALIVAACGGGGGSAPAPAVLPATTTSTAAPVAGSVGAGALSFTVLIPTRTGSSTGRAPQYTSPSSTSLVVTLDGQSTPLATANLSATSPGCSTTNGGTSCTITTAAPAGNDTFVITTYDGANGTGHQLSTARVPQTIAANATTRIPLTLNGVVNSVTVLLGSSSVPVGNKASVAVTIVAYDSAGNAIVGSGGFSPAIQLANGDTSGVTSLSATSVTAPGTTVSLNYNGNSLAAATITPSVSGAGGTMTPATFAPSGLANAAILLPGSVGDVTGTTLGLDGNIWFSSSAGTVVGKITTAGAVTTYPNNLQTAYAYAAGTAADGGMWFGDYDGVFTRVDTSGNVTAPTSYNTPCQSTTNICGGYFWPNNMTKAQDGSLWFGDQNAGYIGTITLGGAVIEYDPTTLPGWPQGSSFYPVQMSSGPADPGAIYAADEDNGYVVRIAIANGVPTAVSVVNTACTLDGIAVGTDGNVWFGDDCANIGFVPIANFTDSAVLEWNFSSVTPAGYFETLLWTNGHLWATNDDDPYTYHIYGLTGLTAAQGPFITALLTSQSFANALTVGSDNDVWSFSDDSQSVAHKIIYGAPTSIATLNVARGSAAVHRGKASSHRFGKRRHQPLSSKRPGR